jgi:hypothetical protein
MFSMFYFLFVLSHFQSNSPPPETQTLVSSQVPVISADSLFMAAPASQSLKRPSPTPSASPAKRQRSNPIADQLQAIGTRMETFNNIFASAAGVSQKSTPHRRSATTIQLQQVETHLSYAQQVAIISYWEDHKGSSDTYMALPNEHARRLWLKKLLKKCEEKGYYDDDDELEL